MTNTCEACHKRATNGDSLRFVKIDGKPYLYCLNDTDALHDYLEKLVKGKHFTNPMERAHYVQFDRRTFMIKADQYENLVQYIKSL